MVGFDLFSLAREEETLVWDECQRAFVLFNRLGTQWRVGMAGATGLDYSAVWAMIDRQRLPDNEADELFADIQVMEAEALTVMAEQRESK